MCVPAMCISLIEIGNLAEFWLGPIYWEASQSGVSGVCTSLHFRQPFPVINQYSVFGIEFTFLSSYICVFLSLDICRFC